VVLAKLGVFALQPQAAALDNVVGLRVREVHNEHRFVPQGPKEAAVAAVEANTQRLVRSLYGALQWKAPQSQCHLAHLGVRGTIQPYSGRNRRRFRGHLLKQLPVFLVVLVLVVPVI